MMHLFLADGFEEIEAFTTLDILPTANISAELIKLLPSDFSAENNASASLKASSLRLYSLF